MNARTRDRSRGQMLVVFAVFMPGIIALLALGIDAGYMFIHQRTMQSAADLAALAGARSLPRNAADANTRARSVAAANGYTTGVMVTTPYAGSPNKVSVAISAAVTPFFLPALGVSSVAASVTAVAQTSAPLVPTPAIFAGKTNCADGAERNIDWSGSDHVINGGIHSNSGIYVHGSRHSATGPTTYYCAGKFINTGGTFSPSAVRETQPRPWPVTYSTADFPCTYAVTGNFDVSAPGPWWVGGTKSSGRLNPGVYCARGPGVVLSLSASATTGTITLVSDGRIELSASHARLTPHTKNVLMFASGVDGPNRPTLKLTGSGGSWTGMLYAPNGQIWLAGQDGIAIGGSLVGNTINLSSNSMTITSSPLTFPDPPKLQLIE